MARAAASRNGAKLGQSLMSIKTGRSGSGNATSPPNTSSPRIAAASKASALRRFSSTPGRSPADPAAAPAPLKKRTSAPPPKLPPRPPPAPPRRQAALLHLELRGLGGPPAVGLEQPDRGVQDGGVVHAVLQRRVRRAAVNRDQLGQGLPFARGEPRVRGLKIRWPIDIDNARDLDRRHPPPLPHHPLEEGTHLVDHTGARVRRGQTGGRAQAVHPAGHTHG